jgi:hypothetical protein
MTDKRHDMTHRNEEFFFEFEFVIGAMSRMESSRRFSSPLNPQHHSDVKPRTVLSNLR